MTTDPVYPDSYRIEAWLGSAWVDLTADVVRIPISGKWGIMDNTAVDLIADTGDMNFLLNNQDDEYLPGRGSSLAGWNKNTPVRLIIVFEAVEYVRFRGYVDLITPDSRIEQKWVDVVCVDWMEYASKYPLVSPAIESDKRADEAIETIVDGMPIAPQAFSYEEGQETFLTVFDTITPKTLAYSEITKLVNSEFGYFYVQKDKVNGETLVFEDRHFRNGLRTLDTIPVIAADSGDLLLETGGFLLLESGGHLILNEADDAVIDNSMRSFELRYGEDIVNRFAFTAHPKRVSESNEVLFSLDIPMQIGSGKTKEFKTSYSDPVGGNQINAVSTSMETPVPTTDYLMNTQPDGSGSDITANLTVTAIYGTEGVTYTLLNSSSNTGYIIKLQARGIGVFSYSPIGDTKINQTSIDDHGYHSKDIDQPYQQDVSLGFQRSMAIVQAENKPRVDLRRVNFIANRSGSLMMAFIQIDIGALVQIKIDDEGVNSYFYIQGIEFSIELGGLVRFSWIVREQFSLKAGNLSPATVEFDNVGDAIVHYGSQPHTYNLTKKTISFWMNQSTISVVTGTVIGDFSNSPSGWIVYTRDGAISYANQMTVSSGAWRYVPVLGINTWYHIVITIDNTIPTAAPLFYIDGSLVTVTEVVAPSGVLQDEAAQDLTLGAAVQPSGAVIWGYEGKLFDVRLYDRVLSAAEVTTLYNSGSPDTSLVDGGMIFQSPFVNTSEYDDLIDVVLSEDEKLFDNVFGYVGDPISGPILRAAL